MSGLIVYNGPSLYDGSNIVVILTRGSKNTKTGNMVQSWIIQADIHPIEASRIGADYGVCGNCVHRGIASPSKASGWAYKRTCYVSLAQAPTAVFNAFKRGSYHRASTIGDVQSFIDGDMLRVGSYGDPASVPADLWELLLQCTDGGHTAYTHGHTVSDSLGDNAARFSMVSADNQSMAATAHNKGYRTFRVIPVSDYATHGKASLMKNEILCPASKESGYKSTCFSCGLCNGNKSKAKSIAIVAHGTSRNKVQ
jgi:hypothetical protein